MIRISAGKNTDIRITWRRKIIWFTKICIFYSSCDTSIAKKNIDRRIMWRRKNFNFPKIFIKLPPRKMYIYNLWMASRFCIHYIIFISRPETSSENENKCTDFLQIKIFYPKTPLNCPGLFKRFSLGGVLLTSGILSSASHASYLTESILSSASYCAVLFGANSRGGVLCGRAR